MSPDNTPTLCCLMLTQPDEVGVTLQALDSLLYQPRDNVSVLLLHNGGRSALLRERVGHLPRFELFESEVNLGVAGGRAFLAGQPAARAADFIVLLDNDLLLPTDYLDGIRDFLVQNTGCGVMGASVLDYAAVLPWLIPRVARQPGPLHENLPRFTNAELRRFVEEHNTEALYFHLGVDADWMEAYFPRPRPLQEIRRRWHGDTGPSSFLASNPEVHARFRANGPAAFEVSNVAGCTQAFRRTLYDRIGGIRTKYSPWGFEDADFCLRALQAGHTNVTVTSVFSLHGTDARHSERLEIAGIWPAWRNRQRGYTLLALDHCPAGRRWVVPANFAIQAGVDLLSVVASAVRGLVRVLLMLGGGIHGFVSAVIRQLRGPR